MKHSKHKYYFDEVYKVNYVFILKVDTQKEFETILKNKYPETYKCYLKDKNDDIDVSIEGLGGRNFQFSSSRQIIYVKSKQKDYDFYATLAHECLHATIYCFQQHGLEYDKKGSNEHFTYYLEMLMAQALMK